MKKTTIALVAIVIMIVAALSVAIYLKQTNDQSARLPADRYVLIEHQVQTLASIQGDANNTSVYTYLGYPTFSYNQSIIAARGVVFPRINESTKAIYQYGTVVGIGGCHGANYSVAGIYQFPYVSELSDGVEILDADGNGYAYLLYKGQPIILEPRGVWYDNQSISECVLPFNSTVDEPIEVNLTISDRITNYGLCEKGEST